MKPIFNIQLINTYRTSKVGLVTNPDYPQGSDDGRGLQQHLAENPPQILSTLNSPDKAALTALNPL